MLVNDGATGQILLGHGSRWGCPLSLILFALVIELLANVISEDKLNCAIGTKDRV